MPAQSLPVAHALGFLSVFLYYTGGGAQLTHREWGGCQGVLLSGRRGLLMTGRGGFCTRNLAPFLFKQAALRNILSLLLEAFFVGSSSDDEWSVPS